MLHICKENVRANHQLLHLVHNIYLAYFNVWHPFHGWPCETVAIRSQSGLICEGLTGVCSPRDWGRPFSFLLMPRASGGP